MDDKLNNNLEEFLNKSMEHFDEVPSNLVWDSIEERLEEEEKVKPFFFRWKFLSSFIVIGLLVTGISWFQLKNNNDIKSIQQQISKIENEKSSKTEVEESNRSTVIDNKVKEQNTKEVSDITALQSKAKLNSHEDVDVKNNVLLNEPSSTITSTLITTSQPIKNAFTNSTNSKESGNLIFSKPSHIAESFTEKTETTENWDATNTTKTTTKGSANNNTLNLQTLPLVNNDRLILMSLLESKNYALSFNKNRIVDLDVGDPIIVNKPQVDLLSKYRIGLNARFANTFIKHNSDFNGTESYGIRHEYHLTDKWALTNSINFNVQHYDIMPESGIVETAVVREYTSRDFNDIGVREIDVNAEYIDIPLGLRYNFKENDKGWNYFVNPSAVWQIYLPQMFSFVQTDSDVIVRNDSRVIASLGSTSLDVGMEKRIGNHFYFQCSLWGEYSFIPLGTQKDKIKLVGVRTSLLFGK